MTHDHLEWHLESKERFESAAQKRIQPPLPYHWLNVTDEEFLGWTWVEVDRLKSNKSCRLELRHNSTLLTALHFFRIRMSAVYQLWKAHILNLSFNPCFESISHAEDCCLSWPFFLMGRIFLTLKKRIKLALDKIENIITHFKVTD